MRVLGDHLNDATAELLDSSGVAVEVEVEGRPVAAPSALAIILHRLADQVRVWQCNDRVQAGSEQSRAQADLDDITLIVLAQVVPDVEAKTLMPLISR